MDELQRVAKGIVRRLLGILFVICGLILVTAICMISQPLMPIEQIGITLSPRAWIAITVPTAAVCLIARRML